MEEFNINELFAGISLFIGSVGGLLLICWKSKCTEIGCCGFSCKRKVEGEDEEKQKEDEEKKKILNVREPEPETAPEPET